MQFKDSEPFRVERTQEERAKDKRQTFTVSINKNERKWLDEGKKQIEETKDSTALKKLAYIGYLNVLHDDKTYHIINTLFKNKKNNERIGIIDFD
jgi:hypothetical protein